VTWQVQFGGSPAGWPQCLSVMTLRWYLPRVVVRAPLRPVRTNHRMKPTGLGHRLSQGRHHHL